MFLASLARFESVGFFLSLHYLRAKINPLGAGQTPLILITDDDGLFPNSH